MILAVVANTDANLPVSDVTVIQSTRATFQKKKKH